MCTSRLAAPLDITADDHLDDTATALSTVKLTPPLQLRLLRQLRHGDTAARHHYSYDYFDNSDTAIRQLVLAAINNAD